MGCIRLVRIIGESAGGIISPLPNHSLSSLPSLRYANEPRHKQCNQSFYFKKRFHPTRAGAVAQWEKMWDVGCILWTVFLGFTRFSFISTRNVD